MALIGYARVSTQDQNLSLQMDALKRAGCAQIFVDEGISAVAADRPGFDQALETLRPGDALVLWKYDRAFRSLRHALDALEFFDSQGFKFRCLTEQIDTSTSLGMGMYQMRHVLAEMERNLIRERTRAGMEAARKAGKHVGRPRKLSEAQITAIVARLRQAPETPARDIARAYGVSVRTVRRALDHLSQSSMKGTTYA